MEEIPRKFFPGKGSYGCHYSFPWGLGQSRMGQQLGERKQLCQYNPSSPGDHVAPYHVQTGTSCGLSGQRHVTLAVSIISKEKIFHPTTKKKMG